MATELSTDRSTILSTGTAREVSLLVVSFGPKAPPRSPTQLHEGHETVLSTDKRISRWMFVGQFMHGAS